MTAPERPRELTTDERTELRRLQQQAEDASAAGWLGPTHRAARAAIVARLREHNDRGVPLRELAGAIGATKQRAHQLLGPDPRSKQPAP